MSPGRCDQNCRDNSSELSRKPTATGIFFSLEQKGKRGHHEALEGSRYENSRRLLLNPGKEAGCVEVC